jgi:rRNA maturation protein Nop10
MSNYCSRCGSKTYQDSLFCETCGSKLKPSKLNSRSVNLSQSDNKFAGEFTQRTSPPPYSPTTPYYPYRRKSNHRLGLILGIIIIGVIVISSLGVLFIGFIPILDLVDSHEYVGTHEYSITNNNFTQIDVIIDNSIGSVNVFYVEDLATVLDAQIHVYAKDQRALYESDVADVGEYSGNHLYFQFTPYSDSFWNNDYIYDIDLYISKRLKSNLQIDISTGSIFIDAVDVLIGELFLETSTGSIEAYFTNVQFNNSEYNYYQIDTSTGSVTTRFHNVTYRNMTNNPQWSISTSTGSVNIDLFHEEALNSSLDIDYDVSTSTGSVICNFGLNDVIGYYLDASTSLGDINIEGYSSVISLPFTSENYQTASLKYILTLSTSTGSIEIYHEPV